MTHGVLKETENRLKGFVVEVDAKQSETKRHVRETLVNLNDTVLSSSLDQMPANHPMVKTLPYLVLGSRQETSLTSMILLKHVFV